MNVICIGTLDKFSRFYLKLGHELSLDSKVKLYIFSIHLSGFLYTLFRLKFSSWISIKTWFLAVRKKKKYQQIIQNQTNYKNIDFKKLINFHLKLNESQSEHKLLLQALAYIDFFDSEFSKKKPDIIILIGDSRLSIEACIALAKQHKIKTYFIEQGPFNTTVFDKKGVNANASIKSFKIGETINLTEQQKININNFINKPKSLNYNRSAIYRGLDLALEHLLNSSPLYPPDLKYTDTFPKLKLSKTLKKDIPERKNSNTKSYLLILQVPMDVNMIYHSPHFENHHSIVKEVHENLPNNSELVLREHPLYKGKYEKELYEYCEKNEITFDINTCIKNSLDFADVVIVNNSTAGIEAIAIKKTVIVLGNSYYDNPKICIKYNEQDDLKLLLKNALSYKPNNDSIDIFLNEFLFNYLIDGFITDKNLIAAKTISEKLKDALN